MRRPPPHYSHTDPYTKQICMHTSTSAHQRTRAHTRAHERTRAHVYLTIHPSALAQPTIHRHGFRDQADVDTTLQSRATAIPLLPRRCHWPAPHSCACADVRQRSRPIAPLSHRRFRPLARVEPATCFDPQRSGGYANRSPFPHQPPAPPPPRRASRPPRVCVYMAEPSSSRTW